MGYIKHLAYCDWPCRKFCLQGCKLIYGDIHTKLFVSVRLKDNSICCSDNNMVYVLRGQDS